MRIFLDRGQHRTHTVMLGSQMRFQLNSLITRFNSSLQTLVRSPMLRLWTCMSDSHRSPSLAECSADAYIAQSVERRHDYVIVNDFIQKYNRYDNYPRNNTKIYALEYAVLTGNYINPNSSSLFSPDEINNRFTYPELRGSVAEFIYAMGMERNGDIVKGGAYAPLFHNVLLPRNQLWVPDLISFSDILRFGFHAARTSSDLVCL